MSQADSTIPSVCYPTCNNAFLDAQKLGKSSQLCAPGSEFLTSLASCKECLRQHDSSPGSTNSGLSQYLNYCDTTTPSNASIPIVDTTAPPTRLVTTTVVATTVLAGHNTTLTKIEVYTSYAPVPFTTTIPQPGTLADGRPTVWSLTAVYYSLPLSLFGDGAKTTSDGAGGSTPASVPPTPAPPTPPAPPTTTPSMAWVAGPVVGGVAVIAILILLGYWWRRRRRRSVPGATAAGTAHEADGKERLEIDGKSQKPELAGSRPNVNAQGTGQHSIQELEAGGPFRGRGVNVIHEA